MFGFHTRSRSLIPIRDMDKLEKSDSEITVLELNPAPEDDDDEATQPQTPGQKRNLIMIYLLFLAEAIMASSLSSQIAVLVPSAASCITADTSFLRSILECSYYFGSVSGIFWGRAADRLGRRNVALLGMTGMSSCCLTMGFARTFPVFAALRFGAGAISSATSVAGLAMLADVSHGSKVRTKVVARLPVIAVCGSLGPLAASGLKMVVEKSGIRGMLGQYPGLASQVACASLVFGIAITEALLLEETLPSKQTQPHDSDDIDSEKAAFLASDTDDLKITIIEALNDDAATPRPSHLTTYQLLTAPSVTCTLASYALLSLHSSTFEILLPHLGHTATSAAGLGIPCPWLQPILLLVKILAALRILHLLPSLVAKTGLLPTYRRASLALPPLYALVPLLALLIHALGPAPILSAILTTLALLLKTTLAGAAHVLVLLLIMSAAPDAASTGSVIGVVSIAELFKALAVAVSGLSYYLSADWFAVVVVNASLWAVLCAVAGVGAAVAWRLRETPRVGADIPEECLCWEGLFDSEGEDEKGF